MLLWHPCPWFLPSLSVPCRAAIWSPPGLPLAFPWPSPGPSVSDSLFPWVKSPLCLALLSCLLFSAAAAALSPPPVWPGCLAGPLAPEAAPARPLASHLEPGLLLASSFSSTSRSVRPALHVCPRRLQAWPFTCPLQSAALPILTSAGPEVGVPSIHLPQGRHQTLMLQLSMALAQMALFSILRF